MNLLGGSAVTQGESVAITEGSSLTFRITNIRSNCGTLNIEDIVLSNTADFTLYYYYSLPYNVRSEDCRNGVKYYDFIIKNTSNNCSASTTITIENNRDSPDFSFSVSINSSPLIYVLGGSPLADIDQNSTTTSAVNGTYFGVVDAGSQVTRRFALANIGSCPLDISSVTSSNSDFVITTPYSIPYNNLASYYYIVIDVTFTAPSSGTGTQTSTISVGSNDTTQNPFNFNVSAEMFDFNIPGPGGITADFRLWLKSTRGIKYETSTSDKVRCWLDLGTNGKNAEQLTAANQPTFIDDVASNINFNPVVKFENNGTTLNQYLENTANGYYTQEIFIVMEPDVDVSSSTGMTIFSGTSDPITGYSYSNTYLNNTNDESSVGLGNFTSRISSPEERLWYNQGNSVSNPYYTLLASTSRSYTSAGIINARNKTTTPSAGMSILYNSVDDGLTATKSSGFTPENLGYIETSTTYVWGTPFKIGKNANATFGSLNGRVAEIFTFAERLTDADRQKIESYLAIKYGISLGTSGQAQKNYVSSFGTTIWNISTNSGFNYNVAGIGRDDDSDLNQKQSKTINSVNDVTIGLGGLFSKVSANSNEFNTNGDFLVWGCDNGSFTESSSNTVSIKSGVTTSVTRIARKWKIIETTQVSSDVENVYVGIPETAFSTFSKTASEEYVLIVADNSNFSDSSIIDVIPLKIQLDDSNNPILDKNGSQLYQTWYDFDGTKYFTFGKASVLDTTKQAVAIGSGDYLVGEYDLNLNVDAFTISAWIKSTPNASVRTIIAKGDKLQMRLNSSNKLEIISDKATPVYTSNMAINDSKWHQLTYVYNSGSGYLYVDGVLDKSVQNIVHPSPNYNRFSIGAVYASKSNITNPFLGEIDEVSIWDLGLTESQIRYLMNQEIEKTTGNIVNGKNIPEAIINNEVVSIPWSNLRAYYDFNSFYGSTIEGLTDDRNFLRLNYLNKTKLIVANQTAPLPYVTAADGDWANESTWLNSANQMLPNSLGLDGVTKIDWNIVETNHNITSNSEIKALGLKINSNTFTVEADNSIELSHYLLLNGKLDLQGESQLIQTMDSDFDTASIGYIERDQEGIGNRFRYNCWSSPVYSATEGTKNYATVSSVLKDGTDPSSPAALNFTSGLNGSISPVTLSTYWMYKYTNSSTGSYSSWVKAGENGKIYEGEGFLMKGVKDPNETDQNYIFQGKPNNGTIELTVSANNDYLVGNPYPSALDAEQFILDNANSIKDGTLYFWEHYGGDSHNLKDYQAGYGLYNLGGGTPASAHSNVSSLGSSVKTPKSYIAVGQGFFVTGDSDGGQIQFNNGQRVFQVEDSVNSVFMKGNASTALKTTNDERLKIRIGFNSSNIDHRQILLTVDERATKNVDWGFDAEVYDLLDDDMFWMINDKKFGIQGINEITNDMEIPVGIKTKLGGLLNVKIDSLENIAGKFEIYFKDTVDNSLVQLTNQSLDINLTAGEYLNRFSLVFKSTEVINEEAVSIETEALILPTDYEIFMNNEISELQIRKKESLKISTATIVNYLGQVVKNIQGEFEDTNISIPVNLASGLYFVQLNSNQGIINNKIIVK